MYRTYKRGTKARLSFSGGPYAPVNMADSMEEVNVIGGKMQKIQDSVCSALYNALFRRPVFCKSLKFFRTSLIQKQLTCHVYMSMWPVWELKLRLALVPHSNILCMIVKLAYKM